VGCVDVLIEILLIVITARVSVRRLENQRSQQIPAKNQPALRVTIPPTSIKQALPITLFCFSDMHADVPHRPSLLNIFLE
jgi:hypothetical protein